MSMKLRKARKCHVCDGCQHNIKIGEMYWLHKKAVTDFDAGSVEMLRGNQCNDCLAKGVAPYWTRVSITYT